MSNNQRRQTDVWGNIIKEDWEKEWQEMPEFVQEDADAYRKIIMSFKNQEDVNQFSKIINQKIGPKTKSLWFPKEEREKPSLFKYIIEEDGNQS